MDAVTLLEKLALSAYHFSSGIPKSLKELPSVIQEALLTNNTKLMQAQISDIEAFAHESHVIQALIYDYNSNFK